jgi:hypothetical protein
MSSPVFSVACLVWLASTSRGLVPTRRTMTPARPVSRLALLAGVLAVLVGIAAFRVWRSSTPAARREALAEQQARQFIALRDREAGWQTNLWQPSELAAQVEADLSRLCDSAVAGDFSAITNVPLIAKPEFVASLELLGWTRWLRRPPPAGSGQLMRGDHAAGETRLSVGPWKCEWVEARLRSARTEGRRAVTQLGVVAFLANGIRRVNLSAEATVSWSPSGSGWVPELADVISYDWRESASAPAFVPWAEWIVPTNGVGLFTDPLIGEFVPGGYRLSLVGAHLKAELHDGRWALSGRNCGPAERAATAVLADVSGSGSAELLVTDSDGLLVVPADGSIPRRAWLAPSKLRQAQCIAVGDIEGDGDLDLWLTQYKAPYFNGQFPTPYFDANDGFPSHLLVNDGSGHFADRTVDAGLGPKRDRRTYSASLADLDGDGDMDLLNVSDFAGVDVFLNDGGGRFTDVSASVHPSPRLFGMAHAVGDFDRDGRMDLLAVGMDSPVASQLDALGLGRPDFPEHTRNRGAMTFGNRLLVGTRDGLRQAPWAAQLASAGWAWGVATLDWNNDGHLDFYFANGHETFANRVDYERQFWTHDIYVAGSTNSPVAFLYFQQAQARRHEAHQSYGGWQANRCFTGLGENQFVESAWLMGVAVTHDCRNVIADDFDGDGRVDLAVTTFEQWPLFRQRLLIFRNTQPRAAGWIGFRLDEVPGGRSPIGARIEIETDAGPQRHWFVTGDSYRAQRPASAHFGLGATRVQSARAVWPDGLALELPQEKDRWHHVSVPVQKKR